MMRKCELFIAIFKCIDNFCDKFKKNYIDKIILNMLKY